MENQKTKIISIVSLIALALTLVTATFAYFMAQTGEGKSTDIKINANTVDTFTFETGSALSLNINQQNFANGAGNQTGTTFAKAMLTANNKTNSATEHYYMYLNISENTFTYTQNENTPEILLTIKDASGNAITSISELEYKTVTDGKGASISGFDITTKSGAITLFDNREITTTSTKTEQWNIKITFVNYNADQTVNSGKNFSGQVLIQKEKMGDTTLAEYVISQYTGTQGENSIYYHNSTLANGAGDNSYRYAGANPNNYVCFGSDVSPCPTNNLYRMIGVIDNKVKLISANSVTSLSWDTEGTNTWESSSLNTYLNETYLTSLGALSEKISTTTWKVGGNTYDNITATTPLLTYQYEIVNPAETTTLNSKIGAIYVSDYYYGASQSAWQLVGYNSGDETKDYRDATNINWLYSGVNEWTISRRSDAANWRSVSVFYIENSGYVADYLTGVEGFSIRPTFFLNDNITYKSGVGTSNDAIYIE